MHFFQNAEKTCSDCLCVTSIYLKPLKDYEECCKCLDKCPCGTSHHGVANEYSGVVDRNIVGCTPCGCGCPVRRIYQWDINEFKCGPCEDYCHRERICYCAPGCCRCCFPASARVFLENGKSVAVSELNTGDRVQSGNFHCALDLLAIIGK